MQHVHINVHVLKVSLNIIVILNILLNTVCRCCLLQKNKISNFIIEVVSTRDRNLT